MQSRMKSLVGAIACLAVAIPAFAQYGHPLKGSWSGDWWLVKGKENHILLDFNFVSTGYGNTSLTGVLNPGPDQSPMQNLTLTPPDVINAGKAAIAARDAALAKQTTEAAGGTGNPAPAPPVAAASAESAKSTLYVMGSNGPEVAALQKKLGEVGFATGETDGKFGKGTQDAVTAYQKSKNLQVDGIVGPKTIAALGLTLTPASAAAPAVAATPARGGRGGATAVKDNVAIASDPWLLHFEADSKDDSGKTVHYIVDGKMENLGAAYSRVITGTWKVGNKTGSFKVIRN
jgi:peptidoglycan hydrolase-like protein with peptidoglycan-binding domain